MKNIRIFHLKIFNFLVKKFSVYLNRHVFIMGKNSAEDSDVFSYMFQKIFFDIPCELSPLEAVCITGQGLFSGRKIRKIIIMKTRLFKYIEYFTSKN